MSHKGKQLSSRGKFRGPDGRRLVPDAVPTVRRSSPMSAPTELIPQPRPLPLLGNLADVDADKGVFALAELAREFGPIYRLELPGDDIVVISSQELVDELCDEQRFDKKLHRPLRNVRDFAGDGLFTAETQEPNWGAAHRILMPAFGP